MSASKLSRGKDLRGHPMVPFFPAQVQNYSRYTHEDQTDENENGNHCRMHGCANKSACQCSSLGASTQAQPLGLPFQWGSLCLKAGALSQRALGWGGMERIQIFHAHSPLQAKIYPNKKH